MIAIWLLAALFCAFSVMVLIALLLDWYYERLHKKPLRIDAAELNELRTTVKFHIVPKEGDHD